MSYETSPILNRIKIIKGWKHPIFPTKTLNYSREMILWFKVYLFLKVYLWCQNIRLLTCEVRTLEKHQKVLYLFISKHRPKKKKVKSKWKKRSFLQNLKSPLVKTQNKKARFLLYRDLRTWKQKTEFFFNNQRKKKISKTWISKSREFSWINFSRLLAQRRLLQRQQQILSWRKKKHSAFNKFHTEFSKKIGPKYFFKKKNIQFFAPIFEERQGFQKKTQKNILVLIHKLQKDLLFLGKILDQLSISKFKDMNHNTSPKLFQKSFQRLNKQFTAEYQNKIFFLKKIERLSRLCFQKEKKKKVSRVSFSTASFATHLFQQKKNKQWIRFFFFLKKQWAVFQKKIFFRFSKKKQFLLTKGPFAQKFIWHFLKSSARHMVVSKSQAEPFLFLKNHNFLFSRHPRSILLFPKILSFKKPARLRQRQLFTFLRLEQQKHFHQYKKIKTEDLHLKIRKKKFEAKNKSKTKKKILSKEKSKLKTNSKTKLKNKSRKKLKKQKLSYRLSVRYNYRTHVTLTSNLKLKYLISDLIHRYFSIVMDVKLVWPLKQFKNLKFYRLLFPVRKRLTLDKHPAKLEMTSKLRSKKKKYYYIGQNTNHLQMRQDIVSLRKKRKLSRKLLWEIKKKKKNNVVKNIKNSLGNSWRKSISSKRKQIIKKKPLFLFHQENTKSISENLSHMWQKKLNKKNKYLMFKKNVMKAQSEKRLSWPAKQKYISNLIITVTLFAKYLAVQPLADHLAKIIGETKKHALILKIVKTVLRTVRFKRGIGYRIALTGRINGSKKSRTFYLKKLNRNRPRQTFSKNVNFAMAQARAKIGSFGVKIWVYF